MPTNERSLAVKTTFLQTFALVPDLQEQWKKEGAKAVKLDTTDTGVEIATYEQQYGKFLERPFPQFQNFNEFDVTSRCHEKL